MARAGKYGTGLAVAVCLFLWTPWRCQGYVMPAGQLLGFTAANFASFETLAVTHTVEIQGPEAGPRRTRFEERLWMKSPDLIRAERLGPAGEEEALADRVTRLLFVKNSEDGLMRLLSDLGINPQIVGFTRLDERVAYRIGDPASDSPQLIIDKKKFLPLILRYRPIPDPGQGLTTVRFEDFRKREGGLYPFKTTCEFGDGTVRTYFVSDIQSNPSVDPSRLHSVRTSVSARPLPGPAPAAPAEERLKELIENLEQEYR